MNSYLVKDWEATTEGKKGVDFVVLRVELKWGEIDVKINVSEAKEGCQIGL